MEKTSAVEFFCHIIRNIKYRKKCAKYESVLLFGGSKSYFLQNRERAILETAGIGKLKVIQCYDKCFVNYLEFTTCLEKSRLRSDSICESNGEFFLIRKIFVAESKPLCFVSKINVSPVIYNPFCFKVVRISKEINVLKLSMLKSKFISSKSSLGAIVYLVKLPNTAEFE
jgi:hypothetical protein